MPHGGTGRVERCGLSRGLADSRLLEAFLPALGGQLVLPLLFSPSATCIPDTVAPWGKGVGVATVARHSLLVLH
jgi:hypothetical protein